MAEAIVMLLLNTGLRVDELVTLTWQRIQLHARSGWIDVVGKGDKRRRLPLNIEARKALDLSSPCLSTTSAAPFSAASAGRTRRAGSSTSSPSSAVAHKSRMCIRTVSVTTQHGVWSRRSTCLPWQPGLDTSDWTRCGSTVSLMKLRSSGPPQR
jgi:hypothetical protein